LSLAALTAGTSMLATAALAADKKGGTLHVNLVTDTDYVDPALAYYQVSWQLEYATCAKLLNYPDREAPAGSQLVPDAAFFPQISKDGKTYTFRIRPGWRSNRGEKLTAANFAVAINRDLNVKMQSPAAAFVRDVVGAQAVLDGKAVAASGVKARGRILTIQLTNAAPDFLARIAMPFFCAVPKDTPIVPGGIDKLDSFGPYSISSYTPNRQIVLRRNGNYIGPRPHNVDKIVYTVGVSQDATLLQLEEGDTDYAGDGVAPSAYAGLAAMYGINRTQFWVKPLLAINYLALNTSRPLFKSNVSLRRAIAYAIDRPALLRQGGAYAGKRATHLLPPGLAGYVSKNLYPVAGPDYATARKLAKGHTRGGAAVLYTCNRTICTNTAQILQYDLKQIGIAVQIKQFARGVQFQKQGLRGEPFDIAYEGWLADYADPYDFVNVLLDGKTIHETNNVNFSYFDDPVYNRKMEAAAKLRGSARYQAYAKLDLDISAHAAPIVVRSYPNNRDVVSSHVGCYVYNPVYGMSLAAVCLK
jgi:ABC-type oligopeptide transport system substrate-binding subunit